MSNGKKMQKASRKARPPPEASRKRKMEMEQGFVEEHRCRDRESFCQVDFQIGEHPMGLVATDSVCS